MKNFLFRCYARWRCPAIIRENVDGATHQALNIIEMIQSNQFTQFGKDHNFCFIDDLDTFRECIPIREYEDFIPYINQIIAGDSDVLWYGRPIYLTKTSGTTTGAKYIPITQDSIGHHIQSAKRALMFYAYHKPKTNFLQGKMIFLQGSPVLDKMGDIPTGRLSGIVYHHVPKFFLSNRKPSYEANIIEDWERKVDAIVSETKDENMSVISGIPPWCVMYLEKLLRISDKVNIKTLFPQLELFIYGGVNYAPYRQKIETLMGSGVDTIETYPASEGFIAYQHTLNNEDGLLLNLNAGIYYEFIPLVEYHLPNRKVLTVEEVEVGVGYALIMTTNAGLWRYSIGDVVKFVSIQPYTIKVVGRVKQFISAFGEHIIAEEIEKAMTAAIEKYEMKVVDFLVYPDIGAKRHEWLIELDEQTHEDMDLIATFINTKIMEYNIYYRDLIEGKVIEALKIKVLPLGSFNRYYASEGKLGGQNKVQRLSNDDIVATKILNQTPNV
jgi:hypothetical protein